MSDILTGLNDAQRKAVVHEQGPLLIVAGAGTGKTTVLTRRIAWLMQERGVRSDEFCALTFTDKAAREMMERIDELMPVGTYDMQVSTFHRFCERVLREYGVFIGIPSSFRVLDEVGQWMLMRRHAHEFPIRRFESPGKRDVFFKHLISHISHAHDELLTTEEYRAYVNALPASSLDAAPYEAEDLRELVDCYEVYERIMAQEECIDFGGLISATVRLLRERPAIALQYRSRFKHVLVDEFQDTNWAQYELVKLLMPAMRSLVVVGDDDQSIYRFRGAAVENILRFKNDFPDASVVVLTDNYRSGQAILDTAYTFIQANNPHRLESSLSIDKHLIAHCAYPGSIVSRVARDQYAEAASVRDDIVAHVEAGGSYGDCAVIARSHAGLEGVAHVLARAGIPYVYTEEGGLFLSPSVIDALSYMRLLIRYHDSQALYRVLGWKLWGISSHTLHVLTQSAHKHAQPLIEVLQNAGAHDVPSEDVARIQVLLAHLSDHSHRARTKTALEIYIAALRDTGYIAWLAGLEKQGGAEEACARDAFWALDALRERIERLCGELDGASLLTVLDALELERSFGGDGGVIGRDGDFHDVHAVNLMTIHGSKGLEFLRVWVIGVADRRFPTSSRPDSFALPSALVKSGVKTDKEFHLMEERRLMYVALTRAKESVTISYALSYGGATEKKPSVFWRELGLTGLPETHTDTRPLEHDEPEPFPVPHEAIYDVPRVLSVSQLQQYNRCPLQYKFSHILRVPTEGKAQLTFGNAVHATLQEFAHRIMSAQTHENGDGVQIPSFDTMVEIYHSQWRNEWYGDSSTRDIYFQKGISALRHVWDDLTASPPSILHVELPFSVHIEGVRFEGKIDRIDSVAGGVRIIDYKTGKKKDKPDMFYTMQLYVYALAVQEVLGLPVVDMSFYYVEEQDRLTLTLSEKALTKVREAILRIYTSMQAGDFVATPEKHVCGSCDFASICEFRQTE